MWGGPKPPARPRLGDFRRTPRSPAADDWGFVCAYRVKGPNQAAKSTTTTRAGSGAAPCPGLSWRGVRQDIAGCRAFHRRFPHCDIGRIRSVGRVHRSERCCAVALRPPCVFRRHAATATADRSAAASRQDAISTSSRGLAAQARGKATPLTAGPGYLPDHCREVSRATVRAVRRHRAETARAAMRSLSERPAEAPFDTPYPAQVTPQQVGWVRVGRHG